MYGNEKKVNGIMAFAFVCYSGVLLWLLFGRIKIDYGIPYWEQVKCDLNLIPLRTNLKYVKALFGMESQISMQKAGKDLFGNILLFAPFGIFLPFFWKRLRSFICCGVAFSLIIVLVEIIQLFTLRGICDIDDLILNVSGAMIGFLLWKHLRKCVRKNKD